MTVFTQSESPCLILIWSAGLNKITSKQSGRRFDCKGHHRLAQHSTDQWGLWPSLWQMIIKMKSQRDVGGLSYSSLSTICYWVFHVFNVWTQIFVIAALAVCWPWQAPATQIKTISEMVREQRGPTLNESSHRPRGPSFDFPTRYEANSPVSSRGLVILVLLVPMKTSAM